MTDSSLRNIEPGSSEKNRQQNQMQLDYNKRIFHLEKVWHNLLTIESEAK